MSQPDPPPPPPLQTPPTPPSPPSNTWLAGGSRLSCTAAPPRACPKQVPLRRPVQVLHSARALLDTSAALCSSQTNQEMSTYVLNTVMSICGPDAALRLAKYPGSKGLERQIEEFVLKYKDTGWPRIKRDYGGVFRGWSGLRSVQSPRRSLVSSSVPCCPPPPPLGLSSCAEPEAVGV